MDDLVTIEIDLNVADKEEINEMSLARMAAKIKNLMYYLFGDNWKGAAAPVSITGTPRQLDSFTSTLAAEKSYMDSYKMYGLANPSTFQDKYKLDKAIRGFESATGLKWPLK